MVFSSMIFLWLFLPITIIGYYLVGKKLKNGFLLAASLFFYAWGEPVYILLMATSILVNWAFGLLMEKSEKHKRLVLLADIAFNLALLGYFKYAGFFLSTANALFHTSFAGREIALPIGISFYTFQILSYMIDLYRGQYKAQRSILSLALYISFFPQLIAGPIVKYKDIDDQLLQRTHTAEKAAAGMKRFAYGLGKKVLIANTLAKSVDLIFALDSANLTGWLAWVGTLFYSLQIYYDFSGYSDMAIGLGKIFGFEFQENFDDPYMAHSIQNFWRRWHISLSSWFREYLYIPLGGSKKGKGRTYVNLLIVFFITGLWHGAGWTFVLWGLYHGLFSIIERLGLKKLLNRRRALGHIYALLVVAFGWVLFRADSLAQAALFYERMLLPFQSLNTAVSLRQVFGNGAVIAAAIGILGCGIVKRFGHEMGLTDKWKNSYAEIAFCALIMVFSIVLLASNTYNPFIYFRF